MISSIGMLGGTGDLGTALAIHLARKCNSVMLGSRDKEKAKAVVEEIIKEKPHREYLEKNLIPCSNQEVASKAEAIIATVPFESAIETIESLIPFFRGDQLFISSAAPLIKVGNEFTSRMTIAPGSISAKIRTLLPESIEIACAFQTIPANILYKEKEITSDVLVACDRPETFNRVSEIVSLIDGLRPLYSGSLAASSEFLEGLTALLLNIAIRNKLKSPTIRIHSF